MRLLALYVPNFCIASERQRRPELREAPCIMYRGMLRPVVAEACPDALSDGVQVGMLLSRALSRCPKAITLAEDPELCAHAQRRLIRMATDVTPDVADGGPGLLYIRPQGLQRLVGDERAVALRLQRDCQRMGYGAKVAIASSRLLAETLARHGRKPLYLVRDGNENAMLRRIPLRLLPELDASWRKMKRKLTRLGQRTWLDVILLGRPALQAQFGKTGLLLWRMLIGEDFTFHPVPEETTLEAEHTFDFPERRHEIVQHALNIMAAKLSAQLTERRHVCSEGRVTWRGRHAEPQQSRRALKEPVISPEALSELAGQLLLPNIDAPLESIRLRVQGIPVTGKQLNILLGKQSADKLDHLAEHLEQRIGTPALMRVQFQPPSHLEEHAFALTPIGSVSSRGDTR